MTMVDVRGPDPASTVEEPSAAPSGHPYRRRRHRGKAARSRRRIGTVRATVAWAFTITGVLCLWLVLFATVLSALQQAGAQRALYDEARQQLALGTMPVAAPIEPGSPVAVITSAAAGWENLVVVEGTSSGILQNGPGHRADTVLPGQAGVSVLYGKSLTYGAPFGSLGVLRAGDRIHVVTGFGDYTFVVRGVRRAGDPLPAPLSVGESRLTLVSVEGGAGRHGLVPDSAVYVDAVLAGDSAAGGAGRPAGVSPVDEAMASDASALVPLMLWLQALLILVIATTWARVRWGAWQTWLVAGPLLVAALWGAANTAAVLLPNVI